MTTTDAGEPESMFPPLGDTLTNVEVVKALRQSAASIPNIIRGLCRNALSGNGSAAFALIQTQFLYAGLEDEKFSAALNTPPGPKPQQTSLPRSGRGGGTA